MCLPLGIGCYVGLEVCCEGEGGVCGVAASVNSTQHCIPSRSEFVTGNARKWPPVFGAVFPGVALPLMTFATSHPKRHTRRERRGNVIGLLTLRLAPLGLMESGVY